MNELLQEKKRYGLEEKITKKEKQLLNQGVPIQKIIGFIDFDNLRINVNRNVLIPRYETQEVVLKALEHITKKSRVLDLCTGSGYIGLTIKQKTNAYVVMSDISEESILQSKENAELHNMDVKIIKSNLFENINEKFNLIVSNPPYIPQSNKLDKSVLKYDPHVALFGGKDGNDFYKKIIKEVPKYLEKEGILILEISQDNVEYILSQGFQIFNDINSKPRIAMKIFNKG